MIVSTDQQAFSVTILVKAEEEETVKQVKQEEEEVEMVEARGHEGLVLEGLAGLRDQGLLLDTRLWTEGQSFQVDQLFFFSPMQCTNLFELLILANPTSSSKFAGSVFGTVWLAGLYIFTMVELKLCSLNAD